MDFGQGRGRGCGRGVAGNRDTVAVEVTLAVQQELQARWDEVER